MKGDVNKMNIAYYSDAKIPSDEANSVHIMKMCQAFNANNVDVELIVPELKLDHDIDVFDYYGVRPTFTLKHIRWRNVKGRAYLYAWDAAKYIIQRKFDLAYGRNINIAFFLAVFGGVDFAIELHQPIANNLQQIFFRTIIRSPYLKKIIVISKKLKAHFCEKYQITDSMIYVAHDGADVQVNACDRITLNGNYRFNVGYIGQLYSGKGMEIIEKIVPNISDCGFHIVGGKKEDVEFWKEKLEKYKNVFFYGFVPHSVTRQYCEAFDVVLAPYSNHVFGAGSKYTKANNLADWMSPLKIFEYMAEGKTIIATNLPVIREIITNRETGLLCNFNNIGDWIDAITWVRNNPEKANIIGKNARVLLEEEYTWEKRACKILKKLCA